MKNHTNCLMSGYFILIMEVMHERNAYNFPLDLAISNFAPLALQSPKSNTLVAWHVTGATDTDSSGNKVY